MASVLVTERRTPVKPASGAVRARAPLAFPTEAVSAATIFPDLDRYRGTPLEGRSRTRYQAPEYGRLEATAPDPSVEPQYGMIVGIPNGAS